MIDITSYDGTPQVFVPRSGNRFFISRSDALLLMCKECGGAVSIVLHRPPGETYLPPVKPCKCIAREDDTWYDLNAEPAVKHKDGVS
jgi:hypothetical protein